MAGTFEAIEAVEPPLAATARVQPTRLRSGAAIAAGAALLGAALAGVLAGPVALDPLAVVRELIDRLPLVELDSGLTEREAAILWQLRLPRVVLGGLVGATLAMAGAAYQGVFRNPLADPYLLGVAAGAGLGATVAIAYLPDPEAWPVSPVPIAAFAGAMVGAALTYTLGRSGGRARSTATLVLAGVAIASFLTAAQTFVQQRHSDTLRDVFSWILGSLGTARWNEAGVVAVYAAIGAVVLLLHRRLLDVLAVGDEEADSLGVHPTRVRLVVVAAATLATAAAVAMSGLIGFVGIIVPHTIRLLVGTSYRLVLPLSIVAGAAFLILADLLARTVTAPAEVPIGVVTAFFGAPFFLVVLHRARKVT
ncbi:MAG: FecCD family ABC transporter permease [Acidimicrobiales bacterium]